MGAALVAALMRNQVFSEQARTFVVQSLAQDPGRAQGCFKIRIACR